MSRLRRRREAWVSSSVLLLGLFLGACAADTAPRLRVIPTTVKLRETATTLISPAEQLVELPPLEGSTTTSTITFPGGRVDIVGRVNGPEGDGVPFAVVHLERLVGDQVASIDVKADGAGNYRLPGVQAGRVRARAWRSPDLAQPTEVAMFVHQGSVLDLQVQKFGGTFVQWSLAPGQPFLTRKANLVIQVATRNVGSDGVVRTEPVPDVGVSLVALGGLQPTDLEPRTTDPDGRVTFGVICNAIGTADLTVTLATGEQSNVSPRACLPEPTTTQPPPPTQPVVTVSPEAVTTVAPVPVTNPVPTEAAPVAPPTVVVIPVPVPAISVIAPPIQQ